MLVALAMILVPTGGVSAVQMDRSICLAIAGQPHPSAERERERSDQQCGSLHVPERERYVKQCQIEKILKVKFIVI